MERGCAAENNENHQNPAGYLVAWQPEQHIDGIFIRGSLKAALQH
jgi:hypothetical protein